MKRTAWKCFTSYVPTSYKVLMIVGTVLCTALSVFLGSILGIMGNLIVGSLVMVMLILVDYFAFSGISVRYQKRMEMLKSSFNGNEVIRKALVVDLIGKAALSVVVYAAGIIGAGGIPDINVFLMFTSFYLLYIVVSAVFLIFTRRKGLSILVQMLFCYLASSAAGGLFFALVATQQGVEKVTEKFEGGSIIASAVILALLVVLIAVGAILLYKDSYKGYLSGFSDGTDKDKKAAKAA